MSARCSHGRTADSHSMPRCAWARTIAPGWSVWNISVLRQSMSALWSPTADRGEDGNVSCWPNPAAGCVAAQRPVRAETWLQMGVSQGRAHGRLLPRDDLVPRRVCDRPTTAVAESRRAGTGFSGQISWNSVSDNTRSDRPRPAQESAGVVVRAYDDGCPKRTHYRPVAAVPPRRKSQSAEVRRCRGMPIGFALQPVRDIQQPPLLEIVADELQAHWQPAGGFDGDR